MSDWEDDPGEGWDADESWDDVSGAMSIVSAAEKMDQDQSWDEDTLPTPMLTRQLSFDILSGEDLILRQETMIQKAMEQFYVSREDAAILARSYNWKMQELVNDWLNGPEKVRKEKGIAISSEKIVLDDNFDCSVCGETRKSAKVSYLNCNHVFCDVCWANWLNSEADKGPSAIFTRCMYPKCPQIVPEAMQMKFLSASKKEKFQQWLMDCLIQGSRSLKWCPYPHCNYAVEYRSGGAKEILCFCGQSFCFKCGNEGHRPASCDVVEQWLLKNSTDSENVNWIIANTKRCPKCNVHIEKNQGCNHMTCRNCRYDFCWLCKGDWSEHGSETGGYYKCNKYEGKKGDVADDEESKAEEARNALEKYMFYFSRYDNHNKSIKFAEETRKQAEDTMGKLQDRLGTNYQDVQFVLKAVNAVIECRRVLKWTYCFGFYLNGTVQERQIFENHQERLEKFTEALHGLSEKPIEDLLETKVRTQIVNYTRVVERYRENVISAIEEGLKS